MYEKWKQEDRKSWYVLPSERIFFPLGKHKGK